LKASYVRFRRSPWSSCGSPHPHVMHISDSLSTRYEKQKYEHRGIVILGVAPLGLRTSFCTGSIVRPPAKTLRPARRIRYPRLGSMT
jgi:hypothetical protein